MAGIWEQIGTAVAKNIDIEGLADKIWNKIWTWAEPKLDETVDKYTPVIVEKLMALMPTLAATVAKTVAEEIVSKFSHVLGIDPNTPVIGNISDLSETIRHDINNDLNIPMQIPVLGDILKGLEHH